MLISDTHGQLVLDEDNIYQIVESDDNAFKLFGIGGNFLARVESALHMAGFKIQS